MNDTSNQDIFIGPEYHRDLWVGQLTTIKKTAASYWQVLHSQTPFSSEIVDIPREAISNP